MYIENLITIIYLFLKIMYNAEQFKHFHINLIIYSICRGCEKSDITKHLLIHAAPKFKCEICGKAFRHLKNRDLHLKR